MNSITDLLDLEDTDVIISDIQIHGQTKPSLLKRCQLHTSVHPADIVCIHVASRAEPLIIPFFRIITL